MAQASPPPVPGNRSIAGLTPQWNALSWICRPSLPGPGRGRPRQECQANRSRHLKCSQGLPVQQPKLGALWKRLQPCVPPSKTGPLKVGSPCKVPLAMFLWNSHHSEYLRFLLSFVYFSHCYSSHGSCGTGIIGRAKETLPSRWILWLSFLSCHPASPQTEKVLPSPLMDPEGWH